MVFTNSRWRSRQFVFKVLAVVAIIVVIILVVRRQLWADTVGIAPKIVGLAQTHVARMTDHGVSGRGGVVNLRYLVFDADENPESIPRDTINWGDQSAIDYLNVSLSEPTVSYLKYGGFADGVYSISRGHTYAAPGVYNATLTYFDSSGNSTSKPFQVIVAETDDTGSVNYPPSIATSQSTDVLFKNRAYNISLLTDDYSELGSQRTIRAIWADGSAEDVITVAADTNEQVLSQLSHTYAIPGEYLASFTVTDAAGESTRIDRYFQVRDYLPSPLVMTYPAQRVSTALTGGTVSERVMVVDLAGDDITAAGSLDVAESPRIYPADVLSDPYAVSSELLSYSGESLKRTSVHRFTWTPVATNGAEWSRLYVDMLRYDSDGTDGKYTPADVTVTNFDDTTMGVGTASSTINGQTVSRITHINARPGTTVEFTVGLNPWESESASAYDRLQFGRVDNIQPPGANYHVAGRLGIESEELRGTVLTPTQYYTIGNHYDPGTKVNYQDVRVAEYQPTASTSGSRFMYWNLEVMNTAGKVNFTSLPVTFQNKGSVEFDSRFTYKVDQCPDLSEDGWSEAGYEQRAYTYPDRNAYYYAGFVFNNCRMSLPFMRSAQRSTVSHTFTTTDPYVFGPSAASDAELLAEFDLQILADSQSASYIGFANSDTATDWPEVGIYLEPQTYPGCDGEICPADAMPYMYPPPVKGSLYVLNAERQPVIDTSTLVFLSGESYRVSLLLNQQNKLQLLVRKYDGSTQEANVTLPQAVSIDSLRFADDGTVALGNKIVGNMLLTVDNLITIGTPGAPVVPPVKPPVVIPPVTPPTPERPATPTAPVADAPAAAQPTARQQLVETATSKSIERRTQASDRLATARQQLADARARYEEARQSKDRTAINAARREVNRLSREVRSAQSEMRSLTQRARLVAYSIARITQLEARNEYLTQYEASLNQQLQVARQQYAEKKVRGSLYQIRRLMTRIRSTRWWIGYNKRLVTFHENRLERESK